MDLLDLIGWIDLFGAAERGQQEMQRSQIGSVLHLGSLIHGLGRTTTGSRQYMDAVLGSRYVTSLTTPP